MERVQGCNHAVNWILAPALGEAQDAHAEYAASVGCTFLRHCSASAQETLMPAFVEALFNPPPRAELKLADEKRVCITVLEGRDLVAKDVTGDSDPYVRVWLAKEDGTLIAFKGQKYKSPVVYKSLCPEWNYTIYYNLAGAMSEGFTALAFELWDEDMLSADDFMGIVVVPFDLVEVRAQSGAPIWLPVTPSKKKSKARVSGELHLRFHFPYIAGPEWKPPLRHIKL
eukprot:TRINITY_DN1166_c0_g1_i1.p1 TRINITY_DN1166_c0_g1~~TRINITY_DN1166_c0_g1_i1.p1  ORF type:complete len:227 (-),score=76.08 TRINITY_DN1166_c0_g1_i1:754-1434(-)